MLGCYHFLWLDKNENLQEQILFCSDTRNESRFVNVGDFVEAHGFVLIVSYF